MVHLQRFHEEHGEKGLVILGVNSSDKEDVALELLRKNSVSFPNIVDSSEAAQEATSGEYKSSGVPLSYIIDREGKIVDAWYGYSKGHRRARKVLRKLGISVDPPPDAREPDSAAPGQ